MATRLLLSALLALCGTSFSSSALAADEVKFYCLVYAESGNILAPPSGKGEQGFYVVQAASSGDAEDKIVAAAKSDHPGADSAICNKSIKSFSAD